VGLLAKIRPSMLVKPIAPQRRAPHRVIPWVSTAELMGQEWNISREDEDQLALASHKNLAAAYANGFFADLMTPFKGVSKDNNLRADLTH
jgi:acetyl-CoA C-acetyltransferase